MAIRRDRETDVWLSDEQLAKCTRADEADDLHSPIPTQMVSNGEHMPIPQTEDQKRVEARIKELADSAAKKLNLSRRQFLATSGGMAAGFLAMNEVYGRFFSVDEEEMYEPAAHAKNGPPDDLFVLDDQLHMVRSSMVGPHVFRAFAQGPTAAATSNFKSNPFQPPGQLDELGQAWQVLNPKLVGAEINNSIFHLMHFVKDVFFDSQTTVGLLSNATLGVFPPGDPNGRAPKNVSEGQAAASLTAAQTAAVRSFVTSSPVPGGCSPTARSTLACRTLISWSGRSRRIIPTRGRGTRSPRPPKSTSILKASCGCGGSTTKRLPIPPTA